MYKCIVWLALTQITTITLHFHIGIEFKNFHLRFIHGSASYHFSKCPTTHHQWDNNCLNVFQILRLLPKLLDIQMDWKQTFTLPVNKTSPTGANRLPSPLILDIFIRVQKMHFVSLFTPGHISVWLDGWRILKIIHTERFPLQTSRDNTGLWSKN